MNKHITDTQANSGAAIIDKQEIDELVRIFFSIFTNTNKEPDWSLIHQVCIPGSIIIKKTRATEVIYNLDSFMAPRKILLTDGTLTGFEEKEVSEDTRIISHIAQRYCRYQKTGKLNGISFKEYGNKFFQFIKTRQGWKINALVWEDEINS